MSEERFDRRQQDFVELVRAVTRIESDLGHVAGEVKQTAMKQDQYIVEHRSHHLEDRQWLRESLSENRDQFKEQVKTQLADVNSNRRVYIGLIVTGIGAVIVDIILRVIESG